MKKLKIFGFLLILLLLGWQVQNGDLLMSHQDLYHMGYTGEKILGIFELFRSYEIEDRIHSSPTVSEGMVFFGSNSVEPPRIILGRNEYEIASGDPLYLLGHTNLEYGRRVYVELRGGKVSMSETAYVEEDGSFTVKFDTKTIIPGGGYFVTAKSDGASDYATVTILKHGKKGLITQMRSTRLTIAKGDSGVLSFTVNNPIGNPTVTEQIVIKVPSGIDITGATFAAGGAGTYVSEPRKLSSGGLDSVILSVMASEFREEGWGATMEGYVTYSYENDPNQYKTTAHTLTYEILPIHTPMPTPTPTPITPTSTPTPEPPGFEAIITIVGLLAVAYLLGRKK